MSDTSERMARVFDEAMRLASDKNRTYKDAWKEHGWRGSLGKVLTKATRLRNMLWQANAGLFNGEKEHPREIAIDMINHLAFFVANLEDGREWGHETPEEDREYLHSGQHAAPLRVDYYQPQGPITLPNGQQGFMEPDGDFTDDTLIHGTVPIPGEEPLPSPKPRGGKRTVKDAPQA